MNVLSYLFLLSVIVYTDMLIVLRQNIPEFVLIRKRSSRPRMWCHVLHQMGNLWRKICPIGKQIRSKAICCSPDEGYQGHSIQEWCKQICHLTGEDFQEIRDIPKETSEIYLKVNVLWEKKIIKFPYNKIESSKWESIIKFTKIGENLRIGDNLWEIRDFLQERRVIFKSYLQKLGDNLCHSKII